MHHTTAPQGAVFVSRAGVAVVLDAPGERASRGFDPFGAVERFAADVVERPDTACVRRSSVERGFPPQSV
jgi:hypothetical protein